jgi:hypothetical protein
MSLYKSNDVRPQEIKAHSHTKSNEIPQEKFHLEERVGSLQISSSERLNGYHKYGKFLFETHGDTGKSGISLINKK